MAAPSDSGGSGSPPPWSCRPGPSGGRRPLTGQLLFSPTPHQWAVGLAIAITLALRSTLMLTHGSYVGIDGGAYILSAMDVMGEKAVSVGFPRPPLAPGWTFVPFLEIWGADLGYRLWAIAASLPMLLPIYLLARDLVNKPAALFCLAFASVDLMLMEMMVDGALPLLAFTFLGLAIWAAIRLTGGWSRLHFLVLAASVGILPYVNQPVTGIAVVLTPALAVSLWWHLRADERTAQRRVNLLLHVLPALFLGVLIALPAAPWYLANMPGNAELRYPGPILFPVSPLDISPYQAVIVFAVCSLVYLRSKGPEGQRPDYRIKAICVLAAVMALMALFISYDEGIINILFRARYGMALVVYPALGWLVCGGWPGKDWRREWNIPVMAGLVFLLLTAFYVKDFRDHTAIKDQVTPETVRALKIAKSEGAGKAIITDFYSLSHWVAALNGVESPNVWGLAPAPKHVKSDREVRCLLGWVDGCDYRAAAGALDAEYILIDHRFPDLKSGQRAYGAVEEMDPWGGLGDAPWLRLRYREGEVSLWEIGG